MPKYVNLKELFIRHPNSYSKRIVKAKKDHICVCCGRRIEKGSSYISVHYTDNDGGTWASVSVCCECYDKECNNYKPEPSASKDQESAINLKSDLPTGLKEKVDIKYISSDGIEFNDLEKAVEYQNSLNSDLLLLDSLGHRVIGVENAIVMYAKSYAALDHFLYLCDEYSKKFPDDIDMSKGIDRQTMEAGIYVWSTSDSKYIHMSNDKLVPLLTALKEANIV